MKLKLSLINLSNEQNKYLTIRNFIRMYFTMKRIMLYTIYKSMCVYAQKQINDGECCGSPCCNLINLQVLRNIKYISSGFSDTIDGNCLPD